ncbi:(p)ppGpp synthase/HD superfamily hydrolase [Rhizobium sp. BK313]|uniref:GTP pyrophosphokinase n=1 Tax=Rhizobium sp. BK313 TaxID=2587081 RepID=UPI001612E240|nr:GTP pyrophosphokinase [Rhizobium sp. BK313]MBB3453948.1 (p)ppGpp synthase/HD superfamily hydrolase [Rhizobium sp. BK313]
MSDLRLAIGIANRAHAGQLDKNGEPYILHPLRVMLAMETEEDRIVGVLHDTIEDTYVTPELLWRVGFSQRIIDAVLSVTRTRGESYEEFILRAKANEIGRRVKLADIADNLSPDRASGLNAERELRYRRAWLVLAEGRKP